MTDQIVVGLVSGTSLDGVDPDAKETVAFALLAAAALNGVPNNVPCTTGADRRVVMGKRCPPT